jgi:glycosyltransferase involved in cell wall biosynthesis
MRAPRVLINALSLSHGGGRTYVRNLLRELDRDRRGLEFAILVVAGRLPADAAGRIPVLEVRLPERPARLSTACRVLYEELKLPLVARRFDLLYCLADLAPVWTWTPTVVALRNLNIYDRRFYDDVRTRTLFRLVRAGLRRADRLICPTRGAAQLIAPRVGIPEDRITVVPHGISPEPFTDLGPPAAEKPYLFLSAAPERHKNIGVLIEALNHVTDPELEVWIAGSSGIDPEHVADLRRAAERLGLASRVRFLGAVPYAEILRYYRGAVALVFPSIIESFGHPLLEAMLAGTPIVASDIPAFREVAGDVALYFPPDDPVALARTVDRLRDDPRAARERVARGRAQAAQFTWSRSVDRLCELFHEALATSSRGRAAGLAVTQSR